MCEVLLTWYFNGGIKENHIKH